MLTLANRGGMMAFGCCQAGPDVLFCDRIVLTSSALDESTLTVVRVPA